MKPLKPFLLDIEQRSQIVSALRKHIPVDMPLDYCEPFATNLGFYFKLLEDYKFSVEVINAPMLEFYYTYRCIKNKLRDVMRCLDEIILRFINCDDKDECQELYNLAFSNLVRLVYSKEKSPFVDREVAISALTIFVSNIADPYDVRKIATTSVANICDRKNLFNVARKLESAIFSNKLPSQIVLPNSDYPRFIFVNPIRQDNKCADLWDWINSRVHQGDLILFLDTEPFIHEDFDSVPLLNKGKGNMISKTLNKRLYVSKNYG